MSSLIESKQKVLCNILLDEFEVRFPDLTIRDECPICEIVGGRHHRTDPNIITNTQLFNPIKSRNSDGITKIFGKAKDQFPEWTKSTDCRVFLKHLELTLKSFPDILVSEYPRIFLFVVKEQYSKEWIMEHIIDTKLDWNDAKSKFRSHFQRAETTSLLRKKFKMCKQYKEESVQQYSDRYLDLVHELGRKDDDDFVIEHFLDGLQFNVRQKFDDHLTRERVTKKEREYEYESLEEVIEICILYDVQSIVSNSNSTSLSKKDSDKPSMTTVSSGGNFQRKYCSYHKSHGHDTSECKNINNGSKADSSSTKSNIDLSHISCWKCNQTGHYASSCTKQKQTSSSSSTSAADSTSSTVTTSNRFDSLAKRESKPVEKLTYNQPGVQATKTNDVAAKAANLVDDAIKEDKPSRVHLLCPRTGRTFSALVDTGANISFMNTKLAKELGLSINQVSGNIEYASAEMKSKRQGTTDVLSFTAIKCLNHGAQLQSVPIQARFELVPLDSDKHQFIIGTDLLTVLFPDNIPSSFYVHIKNDTPSLCRMGITTDSLIDGSIINNEQLLDEMVDTGFCCMPDGKVHERLSVATSWSSEQEYDATRESILTDPSVVEQIEINKLISGFCTDPDSVVHLPVDPEFAVKGYRKQYKVPQAAEAAVSEQVNKWLAAGKIKEAPANCPYNSSLTIAIKKDAYGTFNGYRICLDTRALNNAILQSDHFQLPNIRDVLERFHGCKYFGEIDLSEAYLQFQLDEESQPYTAFTWGRKQYMFVGCPFGISLLPSWFQRVMCKIFWDLTFAAEYLDNIPWGSLTPEEHKHHLLLILQKCNQHNLKIKLSAMKVCQSEMRCLGHLLTREGIALSPSKLEWIANCERPSTGPQMQSFLGMLTFLRPNVRHASEITASLEAVKNVKGDLVWTERMIADWEATKQAVATAPLLAYPDFNKPFHIATDASKVGIGGVLYQPNEYGGDITANNIVSMYSKKLSGSELNYSTYKKELFAIVRCLSEFRHYVWGQPNVIVFTDHKPLTYMFESRDLNPALQQWLDVLLDYQFELHYREGKLNVLPDHLSRIYASEYDGSAAWGVPKVMPWKIQPSIADPDPATSVSVSTIVVNKVTIEEVVDEQVEGKAGNFFSNMHSSVGGGGNADALENTVEHAENIANFPAQLNDTEKLAAAIVELERTGCVIPETDQREELIQRQHAFGHFGINAVCIGLIRNKYWWRGMRADVQRILADCDPCNRFTVVRSGFNPSMYITSSGPWNHLQMDSSVHLPTAPGGYEALLVIIDVFTGFVILRPIITTTAENVANELWNVCCIFGLPKIIQSDNGPEFVNEVIRCLVKLVGIEHRFISPYNPRADGKVERSIQTVMMVIKKMLHGHSNNWTLFVPFAQLSFNNKVAALTGSTPFNLMFGRSLNPICDYTQSGNGNQVNIDDLDTWKLHMEKVQSLIYPAILERTRGSKDKMVQTLNKKRRILTKDSVIKVGAIVMLNDPLRKNKFEPKYIGPYTVIERTRNGNYRLKDGTGAELDRRVPPDQLKLVSQGKRQRDHEIHYIVDYIMDHRGEPGTREYFTKFKGYDLPEWNAEQNFLDTQCITDYWKSKQRSE